MALDDSSDLRILRAITSLEGKLQGSLTSGLAALQASIVLITEAHHKALLEQERRNAEFARSDRLAELVEQVHGHSNKIQVLDLRISTQQASIDKLCEDDAASQRAEDEHDFVSSITAKGWAVSLSFLVLSITIGFVLAHVK